MACNFLKLDIPNTLQASCCTPCTRLGSRVRFTGPKFSTLCPAPLPPGAGFLLHPVHHADPQPTLNLSMYLPRIEHSYCPVGFLLHPVHHVDPAWFAVLGAVVLCVCDSPMEVEKVVHTVEWDMLLFFAAMFIMIEASAEIGMISMIGGWLESAIRATPPASRTIVAIQILLWVSAVISGVLDNIPYTITMVPVIEYLAFAGLGLDLATLAWALNFGACFGGNATLIGASANIVTATLAERAGEKITFVGWLKPGIPVVIVSVAMADVWMLLRFCL